MVRGILPTDTIGYGAIYFDKQHTETSYIKVPARWGKHGWVAGWNCGAAMRRTGTWSLSWTRAVALMVERTELDRTGQEYEGNDELVLIFVDMNIYDVDSTRCSNNRSWIHNHNIVGARLYQGKQFSQ